MNSVVSKIWHYVHICPKDRVDACVSFPEGKKYICIVSIVTSKSEVLLDYKKPIEIVD